MAINFPNNPSDGDTATVGGVSYTYNSTKNAWAPNTPTILGFDSDQVKTIISENTTSASVSISDSAPSSPSAGDLWFDSTVGVLYIYYNDGDSSQWVGISGNANAVGFDSDQVKSIITENSSGGVTSYDSEGVFSNGTSAGDFAFASDRKTLHVWNGTRWDRVYSGPDQILSWDSDGYPNENYSIDSEIITISGSATDPDGFPVTYSYLTTPSNPVQVSSITNNNDGSFILNRSTSPDSDAGSFTFKFIATDGVHKITRNSVITLQPVIVADTLVVAGGGSGGSVSSGADTRGGGGGAGGVLTNSSLTFNGGVTYTITVGDGGAQASAGNNGSNGSNSQLSGSDITTITAVGGGGGGQGASAGLDGGSGGGGGANSGGSATYAGGSGTTGQGYDGGIGGTDGATYRLGGGGGGAGGAGANGSSGPNGGTGVEWPSSSGTYYGGGGGGANTGLPGTGGGGDGRTAQSANRAGTANTGGGGGGGSNHSNGLGGAGGSGVVIIRYPNTYVQAASTTGSPTYTNSNGYITYKFTQDGTITW